MNMSHVVVTGIGVICPLGRDAREFWHGLISGRSAIRIAATGDLAGTLAGQVPDSWLERHGDDRVTALALVALREAWVQAGISPLDERPDRLGIVLGKCQAQPGVGACRQPFHETVDNLAGHFHLGGPRVVVSTACAAGANAVGTAMDLLCAGSADIVAAGGVDVLLPETLLGFRSLKAVSPTPTAPYSRSDGLTLGEGAAFIILETAEHALARGARVLAEVAGYGLSADAYHATSPDPSGRGALLAVRRAIKRAGHTVSDVSYVNGHGTGTPANDQMEQRVMRSLFGESAGAVPLSSTKAAIGHTLGAGGAIEAVVCVLAITHDVLPPTVNVQLPVRGGLDVVPGVGRSARIDVALSNSYAFGGNNCSLVLTRTGSAARPPTTLGSERIVISGLGAVGAAGIGIDCWRSALLAGGSLAKKLRSFDGAKYGCDFGVEFGELPRRPLAPAGLWRHMDAFGRSALAAVVSGWEDAGWSGDRIGRDHVGLVFATGYGPVRTGAEFEENVRRGVGPSPVQFSNSVLNAAAGAICQALNLRGPTTTIVSGGTSAIIALDIAMALIRGGQAERMIVIAADDLCELVLRERARRTPLAADGVMRPYAEDRHGTILGAAAIAIMLDTADLLGDRITRAYCEVSAVSHRGVDAFEHPEAVIEHVLRDALRQGGCDVQDVGYCAGFGSGTEDDLRELSALQAVFPPSLLVSAPKSITGECEAASGAIGLLAAALAVAEGAIPPTVNLERPERSYSVQHVTEPVRNLTIRQAMANAATPDSGYGTALLATVR